MLSRELQEKNKMLAIANEELLLNNSRLQQLTHTLSHNLRAPVATIEGLLSLLDKKTLSGRNKEIIEYLNGTVSRMREVFSEMIDLLTGQDHCNNIIDRVDMQKLFDKLHNAFYRDLSVNDIKFYYHFHSGRMVYTNGKKLYSMLAHLIENAIKFRSDKRQPEIRLKVMDMHHYQVFTVRDNGLGIDMRRYGKKVFYPYQRFHRFLSGKGLGLYFVRLQAESLGGKVEISSEINEFTEVKVYLPGPKPVEVPA